MKRALVCGAGGFIGGHLVKKLRTEGYWVRGVDIKEHEFAPTAADEFLLLDLREPKNCEAALSLEDGHPSTSSGQAFDEVYQLAADMGGMGFIRSAECDIMHNSALINIHMIDTAAKMGRSARRTLEKFVSRMYTNATSIARLTGMAGVLYASPAGRLNSARIATARMGFNQRLDNRNNPINATLRYIVHHSGLVDTVRTIRQSQLVPELATNAANVVAGDFIPVEDPYIAGTAPNLPWWAFSDYRVDNIKPLMLARWSGIRAPLILRQRSDVGPH